jgi:hypothetical protein
MKAIESKRKELENESVLLTKELIEEREEELKFEEEALQEYKLKRFGPSGDLIMRKKQLMQPIQDQIFVIVQDVAKKRNLDFVFDKSADVVMLYAAERHDVSELVLRSITRASKRKQVESRQERKAAEDEEVVPEINKELEERQQALEAKKDAREQAIETRRQKILADREAKKRQQKHADKKF